MLKFGIDRIEEYKDLFEGRTALVTAPGARTCDYGSPIEKLMKYCDLRLLLGPEHGVRGDKAEAVYFGNETDIVTGLPTVSLYSRKSKRIAPETLDSLDCLVYDVQDVGCRYYTFISTLKYLIEDCAAAGKRVVVLDRPNPLGSLCSGNIVEPGMENFVGCYSIPVQYGMTCGEFANMVNDEEKLSCDLHVIPCSGLTREMMFPDWKRAWVMTSPGIPTFDTVVLYPGTCLIEGTNCSEGRGTSAPFSIIGAPFIQAEVLNDAFNRLELPGVLTTPVWFTPYDSKFKGMNCGGIHLHVTDPRAVQAYELGIRLLDLLRTLYPHDFQYLAPYAHDSAPHISNLMGHRAFESDWDTDDLIRRGAEESAAFAVRAEPYRLY